MEPAPEKPYKIIIVGGLKSGKTSFFRRWIYDEFLSAQHYVVSYPFIYITP
jgi:GTPase SAR1 family protein